MPIDVLEPSNKCIHATIPTQAWCARYSSHTSTSPLDTSASATPRQVENVIEYEVQNARPSPSSLRFRAP